MAEITRAAVDRASGFEVPLLGLTHVRKPLTGQTVSGFSDFGRVQIVATVASVRGGGDQSVTVEVFDGEDGTVAGPWEFTRQGEETATIVGPPDELYVVCTPGGHLRDAVVSGVSAVIGVADTPGGPGGSQPSEWATVQINSAELLALDTTPKVLLAAPSGRNYYIVHGIVLHYRFGTQAYVGDFFPGFGFGTTLAEMSPGTGADDEAVGGMMRVKGYGPDAVGATGQTLLQQTADAYLYAIGPSAAPQINNGWNAWLASHIEGKAFSIANIPDADPTPVSAGDGTITARVNYTTIDGAP